MNIEQLRSAEQHTRAMKAQAVNCAYYKDAAPTSSDIYAMAMESEVADRYAKWLCSMAGVPFPPVNESIGTPAAC